MPRLSRGEAPEAEDWVELDRVRRDAGLAVVEVEERDAGHARSSAELDVPPGDTHLTAAQRCRLESQYGAGASAIM
jgi:hypothetical protein